MARKIGKGLLLSFGLLHLGILVMPLVAWGLPLVDLRPKSIRGTVSPAAIKKGRALLKAMEDAAGGFALWKAQHVGEFVMTANWYKLPSAMLSGWPANPQKFRLRTTPGSDDGRLTFLNGKAKGQQWELRKGKMYRRIKGKWQAHAHPKYKQKIIYKAYWFQFLFRVREATRVAYAGKVTLHKEPYLLVFATWGSMKPNRKYDHFLLYIHAKTKRLEWLAFTVREKVPTPIVAKFSSFHKHAGLTFPYKQHVWVGKPGSIKLPMHENTYHSIRWIPRRK